VIFAIDILIDILNYCAISGSRDVGNLKKQFRRSGANYVARNR